MVHLVYTSDKCFPSLVWGNIFYPYSFIFSNCSCSLNVCSSGRHLVPHWREVGTILEQGLVDMLKEDDSAGGIWGTTSARVALFRCISKCFEVLGSALWTEYSAPLLALLLQYLVSCRPPPIHDNLHMAYQVV